MGIIAFSVGFPYFVYQRYWFDRQRVGSGRTDLPRQFPEVLEGHDRPKTLGYRTQMAGYLVGNLSSQYFLTARRFGNR